MTLCGRGGRRRKRLVHVGMERGENNILARMKLSKLRSMPHQRSERCKLAMEKQQGNFLVVVQLFNCNRGRKSALQQTKNGQTCSFFRCLVVSLRWSFCQCSALCEPGELRLQSHLRSLACSETISPKLSMKY